jgi:hypothetical protein
MKIVKLDEIRIDGGTQGRVVIDQSTVYKYKEDMEEGDKFPPLATVYDGTTHWLLDGFHRYHAYRLLGQRDVEVLWKPGTQQEAQVLSFSQNARHGLPRTNADKRKVVEEAIAHVALKDATDAEIARVCAVSKPFVASVRNPEAKAKQQAAREKSAAKKGNKITETPGNQITTPSPSNQTDHGPDEAEIRAAEAAQLADIEAMTKIIEADEPAKEAFSEVKRLNILVANLEQRIKGLMAEKNEAIKMVKDLQKQLKKKDTK